MKKNQRIIIFALVGVMIFSVIGTGLLILTSGDNSSQNNNINDDLAAQLESLNEQDAAQAELNESLAACTSLPPEPGATPLTTPEPVIPDADVTELQIIDVEVGTGAEAQAGSCVTAHYHGTLATDGSVFDSSYERGSPARFSLSQVIVGWQNGVPGMKEGGVRQLIIPSDQAYGPNGNPPVIEPNADLVFTVELVKVDIE